MPYANNAFGATVAGGRIYTLGGYNSSGAPINSVYSAAVNGDGTLGAWSSATSLPANMSQMAVAVNSSYIFSLGGADLYSTPLAAVYSLALQIGRAHV